MAGFDIPMMKANVGAIINTLNPSVMAKYNAHLDAAENVLKNYLYELEQVESRLQKVVSAQSRVDLGEADLIAKKAAIQETILKLNAHKLTTKARLDA